LRFIIEHILKALRGLFHSSLALAVLVCFVYSKEVQGQKHEFGIGLGGMLYKGDLNPFFNPSLTRFSGTGFYKQNLSYATALRAQATVGGIGGNSDLSPNLYIREVAPGKFSSLLFEVSGGLEYNFFNYRDPLNKRQRGTPYLFGGLGFFYFQPESREKVVSPLQLAIPFGLGYKYRLGKHFNLTAEFVARKVFTDYLDGVSTIDNFRGWQTAYRFDNDWYCYLGVHISYTIYTIICPFDYN
jgi:hypothetical protein